VCAVPSSVHRTIEAVWRIESAKVIAGLTRLLRDVGLAEELAQDALVTALEQWPAAGVPDNPGAWLMATAMNASRMKSPLRLNRCCRTRRRIWKPPLSRHLTTRLATTGLA
jgi:predicted RNA polymerase sigma factor